jgi:DNA mismatch repair ATPase MutS
LVISGASWQVSSIKKQYPGVVLMFEVGYKCLLFEEDAEV